MLPPACLEVFLLIDIWEFWWRNCWLKPYYGLHGITSEPLMAMGVWPNISYAKLPRDLKSCPAPSKSELKTLYKMKNRVPCHGRDSQLRLYPFPYLWRVSIFFSSLVGSHFVMGASICTRRKYKTPCSRSVLYRLAHKQCHDFLPPCCYSIVEWSTRSMMIGRLQFRSVILQKGLPSVHLDDHPGSVTMILSLMGYYYVERIAKSDSLDFVSRISWQASLVMF